MLELKPNHDAQFIIQYDDIKGDRSGALSFSRSIIISSLLALPKKVSSSLTHLTFSLYLERLKGISHLTQFRLVN